MTHHSPATPSRGLATVLAMVTTPKAASAAIAEHPTWGWAFLIASVGVCLGGLLSSNATVHAVSATVMAEMAKNPALAGKDPAAMHKMLDVQSAIVRWTWVLSPIFVLFATFLWTAILTVVNAIVKGSGKFATFWALTMTVTAVTYSLNQIVLGLIVAARGANDFNSSQDLLLAMPSLAWLLHSGPKVTAFFAYFTPFTIWTAVLMGIGVAVVAKIPARLSHAIVWGAIVVIAGAFALLAK